MEIFDYIKAKNFMPLYCPEIKNWINKIRGKGGKGGDVTFTAADLEVLKAGLESMNKGFQQQLTRKIEELKNNV